MKEANTKTFEQLRDINNKAYTDQIIEALEVIVHDQMILNAFLREIEVVEVTDAAIAIAVDSLQCMDIVKSKYAAEMTKAVSDVFQRNLSIRYVLKGQVNLFELDGKLPSKNILSRLSFSNYVDADFNHEAISIAQKIPMKMGFFSPFFITAGSGLGKTHLLHAIGNELIKNGYSCIYIDPHSFTKEITELAQQGGSAISKYTDDLKRYDALIFDDIQNLGDRSVTLRVLFELINHYCENSKQIVIASDKLAKELSGFESRFITRFSSGITAVIKAPSIDNLVTILERKLEWNGMDIKNWEKEALRFIARNNSSSIRSIEGAIKRVVFFTGSDSNVQYTAKVVANIFKELAIDPSELTPQRILHIVANYYKINIRDIVGKSRKKEFVVPRHMAIYLIKKIINNISLVEIGRLFGNRDHTTILASLRKIDTEIQIDQAMRMAVDKIEQSIKTVS